MQGWKKIGKNLLFPPTWVILIITIISVVSLVEIFANGWEMSPVAYCCYVLSFYALVVVCVVLYKVLPRCCRILKKKLHENRYSDRYLTDVIFKTRVGLYRSLIFNLIYVAMNAISGIVYKTYWFGIFAVYYGIIAILRFLLIRYVAKNPIGSNHLGELKRARLCAYILMTVNLALSGAVLMMVYFDRGFHYQGFLIYLIALYTFYVTTTAIIDMVKYRKYKSPVMSITKAVNMATALFSMLFLETAMFAQFGADTSLETKRIMIMLTGAGISVVVVSMAIYMIVKTSKEIQEQKVRSRL